MRDGAIRGLVPHSRHGRVGAYEVCADRLDHGPDGSHDVRILLGPDDQRPPFPRDACLLRGDLAHGIAEKPLMVQIDGGEGRHKDAVVRNGIRGVRAPAHADFENDDVRLGRLERHQSGRREELEARRADFFLRIDAFYESPSIVVQVKRHRLAIDNNGVEDGYKMWAVEPADGESAGL
jgi:hypothetical protein